MTSLLPPSTSSTTGRRSADEISRDLATRRPMVLLATLGGAGAALGPLLVCLALAVVGWFLSDGGAHGEPRDALRVGALGWLGAHGSGVRVDGVAITAIPLGVTLVCVWTVWRIGQQVGSSVSGHGPDSDDVLDGQRDWTVPVATGLFAAGYAVTAVLTTTLAATPATDPDESRVVLAALLLSLLVAGPAIAIGSGRAAIWAARVPTGVWAALRVSRAVLLLWLGLSLLAFVVALVSDFSTAANVMSQLHTDPGATVQVVVLSLLLLPNAVVFAGSYLAGPGFTVGAGTLVTPGAVLLGPLPMFPMLAALPDEGTAAGWTTWLVVVPPLVAFGGAAWCQRSWPTASYEEGAVRGLAGGVVAGIAFGVLAALAGGAVGPGRMADVGPLAFQVLLHGVASFGIGGLLGGLATTWWQRRSMQVEITLDD